MIRHKVFAGVSALGWTVGIAFIAWLAAGSPSWEVLLP